MSDQTTIFERSNIDFVDNIIIHPRRGEGRGGDVRLELLRLSFLARVIRNLGCVMRTAAGVEGGSHLSGRVVNASATAPARPPTPTTAAAPSQFFSAVKNFFVTVELLPRSLPPSLLRPNRLGWVRSSQ